MWKPVSNRTPGIISKLCKLGGGTPALLRPVGTLQDFAWLELGKVTPARKNKNVFFLNLPVMPLIF